MMKCSVLAVGLGIVSSFTIPIPALGDLTIDSSDEDNPLIQALELRQKREEQKLQNIFHIHHDVVLEPQIPDTPTAKTTPNTTATHKATATAKAVATVPGHGDDYPYKTSACVNAPEGRVVVQESPLGTYICQCTDFVLWRLNQAAGGDSKNIKFVKPKTSLNAYNFPGAFANHKQDSEPQLGDVAVMFPGSNGATSAGHVAYVVAVNKSKGTVTVEQYNWATTENKMTGLSYSKVEHPKNYYSTYIHFGLHPKS
ncbi:MAG: CHAP domain-containing protein [Micrococcaceae bacterium]